MQPSPFLAKPTDEWLASNQRAFAILDGYPVSPGHSLIVPRRPIESWWEASAEERTDLIGLVDEVKALLDARFSPEGYNIGFNCGAAAGQTVPHFHIHIIPRFSGDVADPRGGIRAVIPGRAAYHADPGEAAG